MSLNLCGFSSQPIYMDLVTQSDVIIADILTVNMREQLWLLLLRPTRCWSPEKGKQYSIWCKTSDISFLATVIFKTLLLWIIKIQDQSIKLAFYYHSKVAGSLSWKTWQLCPASISVLKRKIQTFQFLITCTIHQGPQRSLISTSQPRFLS